jgi:hypothetical protein
VSKVWWFVFIWGWSDSILQFRQNIIKVGSKSWLLICSSNITLNPPSYTGSALKRELNFCISYRSLLYFWIEISNASPKSHWPHCAHNDEKTSSSCTCACSTRTFDIDIIIIASKSQRSIIKVHSSTINCTYSKTSLWWVTEKHCRTVHNHSKTVRRPSRRASNRPNSL